MYYMPDELGLKIALEHMWTSGFRLIVPEFVFFFVCSFNSLFLYCCVYGKIRIGVLKIICQLQFVKNVFVIHFNVKLISCVYN